MNIHITRIGCLSLLAALATMQEPLFAAETSAKNRNNSSSSHHKYHNHKHADTFSFGAVGDQDYRFIFDDPNAARKAWVNIVNDINSTKAIGFTIHVGDIGTPLDGLDVTGVEGDMCKNDSQTVLDKASIMNSFKKGVVYTPGDNEWSDCAYNNAAANFFGGTPPPFNIDPQLSLSQLRAVFYPDANKSLGTQSHIHLIRQENYPENVRYSYGDVLFTTFHATGGSGSFETFDQCLSYLYDIDNVAGGPPPIAIPNLYVRLDGSNNPDCSEQQARQQANVQWLWDAYRAAKKTHAKALVIAHHADLRISPDGQTSLIEQYTPYVQAIRDISVKFKKPVLVLFGDSHVFMIDKPFKKENGEVVQNATRLEVFGSDYDGLPNTNWIQVNADTKAKEPFSFDLYMVQENPPIKAPVEQIRTGCKGKSKIPLHFAYSGDYRAVAHGLARAVATSGMVSEDITGSFPPDLTIAEVRDLVALGYAYELDVAVPPNAALLRFALDGQSVANPVIDDLDIYVFGPDDQILAGSLQLGSSEQVTINDPTPGIYKAFVHAYTTVDTLPTPFTIRDWVVFNDNTNLEVHSVPHSAKEGTKKSVTLEWSCLDKSAQYLGVVNHESNGEVLQRTIIQIAVP